MQDKLWAPWRLAYVAAPKAADKNDACFICGAMDAANDRENLLVRRGERAVVILNRFPYNNGHLLVAPAAHKGRFEEVTAAEHVDCMETIRQMIGALDGIMRPDGYNVGLNLGTAAGAGLPGHLHWHVVPRWNGDTNFMPVLTSTKVIVQSLETLYDLLVAQFQSADSS